MPIGRRGTRRWAAAAAVVILAGQATGIALRPSTVNCTDPVVPGLRACVLSNVVLWNYTLWVLAEDETPSVPAVRTSYFEPIDFREDEADSKRFLTRGQFSAPPFDPAHVQSSITAAIFYKRTHIGNWFHTFQEDGAQIYNLFCTYLGLCAYDDFYSAGKNTALLIGDWAHEADGNFGEVLRCHGRHIQVIEYGGPPVLIERMTLGVGDHCNAQHCFNNPSSNGLMKPLQDSIIQGWVQHMRYCAGLPPEPAQRQTGPPHVVFVNRAINSGRSVLPMGQVYASFAHGKRELAATFSMSFLEDMNWKDAAAVFDAADVVVTPHGAQASGALFMPHDSQFVHFASNPSHANGTTWVAENVGVYIRIQVDSLHVDIYNETTLAVEGAVAVLKGINNLSMEDLAFMIEQHGCPEASHPDCPDLNNFSRFLNYNPPKDSVIAKVEEAIRRWYQARQQQVGSTLGSAEPLSTEHHRHHTHSTVAESRRMLSAVSTPVQGHQVAGSPQAPGSQQHAIALAPQPPQVLAGAEVLDVAALAHHGQVPLGLLLRHWHSAQQAQSERGQQEVHVL